ncbi:MAG: HAD-IA family hydrolase [Deltaproteobacteria bacterium]|nr:HAD-IA family hydrolase [Deltaproteobacteria bacterium]
MRAVIFDFDGLIVDTETAAFEAWSAIYREHGAELLLKDWVGCVGAADMPFDAVAHLAKLIGRPLDKTKLMAEKEARKAAVCNSLPPLPGVVERMAEAEAMGLPIAVASSSAADWVHGHLDRLGLRSLLKLTRTRGDVARGKPHPDLFISAAAGLGVDPSSCVVFEDSANGLRAAKSAGARCFIVPNRITAGSDFAAADGIFASLALVSLRALGGGQVG